MVNPANKYRPLSHPVLSDRRWPEQTIQQAPIWCSVDLRDGNQALARPMDGPRKLALFRQLVAMGFKEIEVGFPAAAQVEFDFIRQLIEEGHIPDDVTVQILTPARPELIRRSFAALRGAARAIVHLYNSTSPVQRRVVFGQDEAGIIRLAEEGAAVIRQEAEKRPETHWTFQYSPESYSATEPEFALEICRAVLAVWQPTPERKVILNLPATVELYSPNRYADRIEWFIRHCPCRESVVISIHPHNDRGTAVAAAELALLAGAERVEGALFGNGERTGNLDVVTLAMNLYTQGVDPGLDFSRMEEVVRLYRQCVGMPVHPRHPYAGSLVFTAFSGSHQDAIRKGLAAQEADGLWEVPYLPLDPTDIGRSYETIIRVNSQSGKGGAAFLLEQESGVILPRTMQGEFGRVVQKQAERQGGEVSSAKVWQLFVATYLEPAGQEVVYLQHQQEAEGKLHFSLRVAGRTRRFQGGGNGPIDAFMAGLPFAWRILHYEERAVGQGSAARAVAFVELAGPEEGERAFGVGLDEHIVVASFKAIVGAVNRLGWREADPGWAAVPGGDSRDAP